MGFLWTLHGAENEVILLQTLYLQGFEVDAQMKRIFVRFWGFIDRFISLWYS